MARLPLRSRRASHSVWRGTAWPGRRLAIGAAAVAAVVAAGGIAMAVQSYNHAKRTARQQSQLLAANVANEASSLAEVRIEVLRGIAASDPVVRGDLPAMRALFRAMLGQHVVLDDMGWVSTTGRGAVLPSAPLAQTRRLDLSEREYAQVVRSTQRPYVSNGILSRGARTPVVVLAVPTFDRSHRLTGVVTGVLRLDELRPSLQPLRVGETVRVLDRVGHVIVTQEPTTSLHTVSNRTLFGELRLDSSGVRQGTGLDGDANQLMAFASSHGTGWLVVVSEPASVAYAAAWHGLRDSILRWLGLFVAVVAVAFLTGRRLDHANREGVTRTADFVEAAGQMTAATTVGEIADIYTRALRNALGAVSATVAVVRDNEIVPYFASGTRNEQLWRRLPWESPVGAAVVTQSRVQAANAAELRARYPLVAAGMEEDLIDVAAISAVPLPAGPVRGATAALFSRPRSLSEIEWLLLEAYSKHVAQAIERALLYESERQQRLRAEEAERREHAVAARLQRALLPDSVVFHPAVEIVARYQAGTAHLAVGGDWYDTFLLPDGRVGLTVGDVAGHGIDAAATMGRIRSAVGAFTQDNPKPGGLIAQLDGFVTQLGEVDFLTLCHASLDPATGTLEYASAGHPPMLVLDPEGNASLLERGRSPALPGIGFNIARPTARTRVEPGSRLVLYTDGLVERKGELLDVGLARLSAAATELRDRSCDDFADELIERMAQGHRFSDDVALLAVDLVPVRDPAAELVERPRLSGRRRRTV